MTPEEKKWVESMKSVASSLGKDMYNAILLHSISIIEKQERMIERVKVFLGAEWDANFSKSFLSELEEMER